MRRVSPLCAAFASTAVYAQKRRKSPRCTDVCKKYKIAIQQRDCDFERRRSGMDELSRFARKQRIWSLCRRRSQHRIWLVAGDPAPRQMLFAGRSPYPLLRHKVRCACNALRERAFHAPLPCSSVPNKTRFAGLLFGRGKRKIRRKICEKTSNSVFGSHHRI